MGSWHLASACTSISMERLVEPFEKRAFSFSRRQLLAHTLSPSHSNQDATEMRRIPIRTEWQVALQLSEKDTAALSFTARSSRCECFLWISWVDLLSDLGCVPEKSRRCCLSMHGPHQKSLTLFSCPGYLLWFRLLKTCKERTRANRRHPHPANKNHCRNHDGESTFHCG